MARTVVKAKHFEPVRRKRAAVLDHLRGSGRLDEAAIERAEAVAQRTRQPVEQILNQLGSLPDEDLVQAYAQVARCEVWDPNNLPPLAEYAGAGVAPDFLRRAKAIPLAFDEHALVCAACDPLDDESLAGLAFASGRTVTVMAARPADFRRAFDELFGTAESPVVEADSRRVDREVELLADGSAEGGGARLVAAVFEAAVAAGASDIHFEPRRHDLRIRLRIDGRLLDHQTVSADLAPSAVSRIKVIANLNLGERRLPQDGRTTFVVHGKQVDVRVATSPTVFGEAAVLRILDRTAVPLDLKSMGLGEHVRSVLAQAARFPHGLFLVTGPTGSGKTTTLYALLQTFAASDRKVLSVEDPVEYHFEHVTQTQVAPHLGLTFASALRSFLRQDPDVILVGEIRDPETAAVAIQAAMTGHFVLASIHANNALGVLPRLQDMGIEPYQLAACYRGAVAQRLVRRLCVCRREVPGAPPAHELRAALSLPIPIRRFEAVGCPACKGTGFKGRLPIGEAYLASEPFLRAVADRAPPAAVADLARQAGLTSMLADGFSRADEGATTDEEVVTAVDV